MILSKRIIGVALNSTDALVIPRLAGSSASVDNSGAGNVGVVPMLLLGTRSDGSIVPLRVQSDGSLVG